ncbi:MAG TPA: Calx-beta domain-containing protein, partial [Herpetosiphonaceae bacterium]
MTTLSATSTPPPEPKSQKPIRPSRRDSPNDRPQRRPQPESSAEFGAAAIGDTIVTHNLPKVTFRVNDGFDLDQYLYADSSPLNFEIDLKGYKVAPGKSAKVTLNVYDIDSAGGDGCQPEVDKLYLNGTFLTDLTGANDEWRLVTVDVPGTAFNPGRNMFEVQIDTLGTGCWAVEVDWAEVEIDFNIAQLEANALDDVTIKRGKTDDVISDTIWKTVFTASGAVDPNADPNDPIAGKIRGAGEFTYKYKLDTWPTGGRPTWQPKVKYQWEIQGSSVNSGGVQELTGWEQDITVKLPDKVGKYTLRVTLEIYDQDKLLRTEVRSHPLYVLLDTPVGSVSNSNGGSIATGQPKAAWLDVALDSSNPSLGWAAGKQTEVEILEAINTREYANPFGWVYGYYAGNPFKDDAITLLENGAGKRSDCFVFRDVWRVLAGSLGITTSTDEYRPPRGFMTSTRRALEGGGNARPVGSALDRWVFGNHQYGTYNGRFYDPTFGLVGPNTNAGKEGNLFCKIDGVESGRIRCRTLQQPPAKALLRPNMGQINGWSIYEYETFNTLSVPSNPSTLSSIAAAAGSFTGTPTDQGVDTDGNGLYEQLRVNVPLNVTQAGTFGVTAILAAPNGEAIALGSVRPELLISGLLTTVDLPSGQQTLSVYFNGYDLRTFNAAGPYTVMLELTDETGTVLDTSSFTTSASNPQSFQGPLVAVQTVTDQGINADATPGFEHLRVTATLNAAVASTATISAQIFAGESLLDTAEQTLQVAAGSQQVDLSFAGQSISASRADGPYTVYISVSDPYYPSVKTHTTAAYRFTDFQRPAAYLTGTVSDQGTDTNGNGQFETLTVAAEVSSLVAGTYTLYGRLKDSADALIATAETTVTVDATNPTRTAMLQFSGPAIYSHQVNGPYSMALVLADAGGNDLMDLQQTTGSYLYGSFEQPAAALTGSFADSGIDSDGNGLFNRLQIAVGVQVGEAGAYAISGSLLDSNGGFVTSATTESTLSAGAATVNLNFDGGAIRQHGANGPYRLVSLSLRKLDGTALDSMVEAHQTSAYQVTQFQSTGLITGNFTDRAVDANGNGLFEHLIIDVEVVIPSAATYTFNGRIVDSAGAEIAWTSGSQTLSPGVRQVSLRFEGRSIHAHGVDGQYQLRDLHVYSNTVSDRRIQAYTTAAYQWNTFEPAAMIRGTVTNGGQPVPNATITLSTLGSVVTDINGAYQFPPVNSGTYTISISANASLAPWRILANGTKVSQGTSATLNMPGGTTTVDFISATANPSCPPQGEDLCVRLSTAAASVDESTSSVTFGAVLSAAASYPVTVSYATSNGTAMAGSDYTAASGTLTFAPGETSKTISVPIRNDVNDEPEETFRLALTTSKDLIIEAPATATVTIQDNDAPPAVSLSASSYSVGENAAAANITVRLSAASAYTVTVEYATSNGTATAGSDYTTSTGTVTFAPGEASKIISVPLLEDGLLEPNETFTVSLSSPSNATLGTPTTGTVTISANDTITFSASAYSVGENAAAAALTVRLNAASAQSVTVEYATSDGTATAGSDYTASTGTVTFAPGETSKTVSIPLLEDGLLEGNETFTVSLSNPGNAGLGTPATATVTISSNDAITFSASTLSVGENAAAANVTVRLSAVSAVTVTVEYATSDGTATAGSDYTTSTGTVTFAPGETSKTISVPLLEDGLLEPNETFTVSLSSPSNAGLGTPATATVTISSNDAITFSASAYSVGENAAAATLTVRLNAASAQSVTVEYATGDGTATAGSDYTTSSGTVTFAPGETSKTISIPLLEDGLLEANETFTVSLSNPANAGLGTPATATVTINANDTITFSASTLSVGENAAAATLTVRLNVASAQSVTVEYATSDGTA